MNTPDTSWLRDRIHSLLHAGAAAAILDLGCGRGTDLLELGAMVPPGARLVGVDASARSVDAARAATRDDPRYTLLEHDVSDGLPFPDDEFDRVMSINLLECIPDKQRLLREVHRVLRPGGIVVFAHFDWDSQLLDGHDKDLVRKIVHAFGDLRQTWMADADAWMGRRLWRTFQASGLFEGSVEPLVLTSTRFEPGTYGWDRVQDFRGLVRQLRISQNEYDAFLTGIQELAAADQYLYSITMYVYVGTKRAPG